jgi:hypothetical protein
MPRTRKVPRNEKVNDMQLIQIQQEPAIVTRTVREMFEELAHREAESTRIARERILARGGRSDCGQQTS